MSFPAVQDTREQQVMQYLLDLLTDGIFTSATQRLGYALPHDKVSDTMVPFVQVYAAVTDTQVADIRNPVGQATFTVDLFDVAGQAETLRHVLAALDIELRNDRHWRGMVQWGGLQLRAVAERPEDNRSYASANVTVQYEEGGGEPERVELCDFSTLDNFAAETSGIRTELSPYVVGCWGMQKTLTDAKPGVTYAFPSRIDLTGINRLRASTFINQEFAGITLGTVLLRLWSDYPNTDWAEFVAVGAIVGSGWLDLPYAIQLAPSSSAGTLDLSSVSHASFFLNHAFTSGATTQRALWLLFSLYHSARDTGSTGGYAPGF